MTKYSIGIVIGLVIGLCIYFISTLFGSYEFISSDYASVVVINNSGQQVTKVVLKHKTGTIEATNISHDVQVRFIFPNKGENSYKVTATLGNDSAMTTKEVYIEHGYRATETITKTDITTKNNW